MNKFLLIFIYCTFFTGIVFAQEVKAPKWVGKVQKGSVFSVVSYDKDKNMLQSGTGFYIDANGMALADYNLFKGAYSAVVIDMKGKKYDVSKIMGADDMYSLVKFKVNVNKSIPVTTNANIEKGGEVYAVKFSQTGSATCPHSAVSEISPLDSGFVYYTLSDSISEEYTGAPLFNAVGEVVGIVQPSILNNGYAIGVKYAENLKIEAITNRSSSAALNNIKIYKGLPDTMEEALVYVFFQSKSADNDEYMALLNEFVETYPQNAEGYLKRATPLIDLHRFDEAERDLQTYLSLAEDKAKANSNVAEVVFTKLRLMADVEYDKWDYPTVHGYVDKAISLAPENVDYQIQKAQVLMNQKEYGSALEIYDKINAGKDKSPGTFYAAFLAHEALGDTATVKIAMLDSALVMYGDTLPSSASTLVMLRARLCESVGKYREAVRDFNTYSSLIGNQVNDNFYYDRSQLELKGRMYQQCLDDLESAIKLNPREPLYHVEKSGVHLRVNQLDECIEEAKRCIELDDKLFDAYRILGYAQIQKGDNVNGRKNLEKAISLGDTSAQEIIDTYLKSTNSK
ncbi:MAG: hypothetical protein MJZ20_11140 [Bacteroidaceae bacterium]|nr:hypothetical protein [Bacteroidaceae bacterium]